MKYALHWLIFLWIMVIILPIGCASSRLLRYHDIPAPGGNYVVGTRVFEWTDSSRTDIFSDKEGALRRIIVQIWYPGKRGSESHDKFSYFQKLSKIFKK